MENSVFVVSINFAAQNIALVRQKGVHEAFQQKINNNNQSHKSTILLIQRYSYEMFQL